MLSLPYCPEFLSMYSLMIKKNRLTPFTSNVITSEFKPSLKYSWHCLLYMHKFSFGLSYWTLTSRRVGGLAHYAGSKPDGLV
jgi:serine protease inhibitor